LDVTPATGKLFGSYPVLATYDGNISTQLWETKKIGFAPKLNGVYSITNLKYNTALQAMATGKVEMQTINGHEDTQYWDIMPVEGDIYEVFNNKTNQILQDKANQLALTAKENTLPGLALLQEDSNQNRTVPIHAAEHPSEQWFVKWAGGDNFYVLNAKLKVYLGARKDGSTFTSDYGREAALIWKIKFVKIKCLERLQQCPAMFRCGHVDDWCGGKVTCGFNFTESHTANGTCKGVNQVTGDKHVCNANHMCECSKVDKCTAGASCGSIESDGCGGAIDCGACAPPGPAPAPMASPIAAPAPAPYAWEPLEKMTTTTFTTTVACLKACDSPGWQCGFVPDTCGNMLPCGKHKGLCAPNNVTGAKNVCDAKHACACVPRITCDKGATCGEQTDGCGGMVQCGNCTDTHNWQCKTNKCVCTPDKCTIKIGKEDVKRCGAPVDNGCGKKLACKCTMANEVCNRKQGKCLSVPGPTADPALFAPTTPAPPKPKAKAPAPAKGKAPAAAKKKKKDAGIVVYGPTKLFKPRN